MQRTALLLAFVATSALLASGCGGKPAHESVMSLRSATTPYFYVGESFRGLPLTHVEASENGAFFVYGDCTPGSDTGCAPPLQIQQRNCAQERVLVAIYRGSGSHQGDDERAARLVRPLNRAARDIRPSVSIDRMGLCPGSSVSPVVPRASSTPAGERPAHP